MEENLNSSEISNSVELVELFEQFNEQIKNDFRNASKSLDDIGLNFDAREIGSKFRSECLKNSKNFKFEVPCKVSFRGTKLHTIFLINSIYGKKFITNQKKLRFLKILFVVATILILNFLGYSIVFSSANYLSKIIDDHTFWISIVSLLATVFVSQRLADKYFKFEDSLLYTIKILAIGVLVFMMIYNAILYAAWILFILTLIFFNFLAYYYVAPWFKNNLKFIRGLRLPLEFKVSGIKTIKPTSMVELFLTLKNYKLKPSIVTEVTYTKDNVCLTKFKLLVSGRSESITKDLLSKFNY